MNILNKSLNKEPLQGLSNLFFDLAKGAFALMFFPIESVAKDPLIGIGKIFIAMITGLVFTYGALVILKLKEGTQI